MHARGCVVHAVTDTRCLTVQDAGHPPETHEHDQRHCCVMPTSEEHTKKRQRHKQLYDYRNLWNQYTTSLVDIPTTELYTTGHCRALETTGTCWCSACSTLMLYTLSQLIVRCSTPSVLVTCTTPTHQFKRSSIVQESWIDSFLFHWIFFIPWTSPANSHKKHEIDSDHLKEM